ncbi:MAG: hypothetical protein ACFFDN_10265 [Candidatus Hodarchaeota archaeon]
MKKNILGAMTIIAIVLGAISLGFGIYSTATIIETSETEKILLILSFSQQQQLQAQLEEAPQLWYDRHEGKTYTNPANTWITLNLTVNFHIKEGDAVSIYSGYESGLIVASTTAYSRIVIDGILFHTYYPSGYTPGTDYGGYINAGGSEYHLSPGNHNVTWQIRSTNTNNFAENVTLFVSIYKHTP